MEDRLGKAGTPHSESPNWASMLTFFYWCMTTVGWQNRQLPADLVSFLTKNWLKIPVMDASPWFDTTGAKELSNCFGVFSTFVPFFSVVYITSFLC